MGTSEKRGAPAIEPYLQLVEEYASSFERPELRLRFLSRTLARQSEREERWQTRLKRVAFLRSSRAYRWLLDYALHRTIFEEFQRLLPETRGEQRRIWLRAPRRVRLFFRIYRARHALYALSAALGVCLLFGLFTLGRYTVRRASAALLAKPASAVAPESDRAATAPSAGATSAGAPSASVIAVQAFLPDYRPEKVWLVEQTSEYERYSNGGRILRRYETENHPRFYLRYPRDWTAGSAEPVEGSEPVGIIYHSSESDIVPFTADNSASIQARTNGLIEYIRARRSYNYLIDRFGEIYRIVRDDHAAHHAGHSLWADEENLYVGLNESFIGICFESTSASGGLDEQLTEAQLTSGRALTAILRSKYHLSDANCTTHGLVSIDPARGTIAHHHDWVRNFPFAAFSLSDKYRLAPVSVARYGFGTDEEVLAKLGGRVWEGAAAGEAELRQRAEAEHLTAEEIRARGVALYREQMEMTRRRRAQALGATTRALAANAGAANPEAANPASANPGVANPGAANPGAAARTGSGAAQ